jgi:hypothetical protein
MSPGVVCQACHRRQGSIQRHVEDASLAGDWRYSIASTPVPVA